MSDTMKSRIVEVGTSATTLLNANGVTIVANSILIGNVDGANAAVVDIALTKSGGSAKEVVKSLSLEGGTVVELLIGAGKLILESGDLLTATASAAGDINVTASYVERT